MEPDEVDWGEVEEVERTKLDDWFNDIKTQPLKLVDNLILGMVLTKKTIKITYVDE